MNIDMTSEGEGGGGDGGGGGGDREMEAGRLHPFNSSPISWGRGLGGGEPRYRMDFWGFKCSLSVF